MKRIVILAAICLFVMFSTVWRNVQAGGKSNMASFTTINRYAKSTTDFGEGCDIRNLTSEALLSESRLSRQLTTEELKGFVRSKDQVESFNNIRFRPDLPFVIDFSYKYRNIANGQITNYYNPNAFNDVNLSEYGFALQTSTNTSGYGYLLRGSYKRINREGVIEFLPTNNEDINQYEVNALFSKENFSVYGTYVLQQNKLNIPNPYDRNGDIIAFLVTYGTDNKKSENESLISSFENLFDRRFEVRGLKLFSGVVLDTQTYGSVDVKKNDYFIGTSLSGWLNTHNVNPHLFDISIESDIYTSNVQDDSSQKNAQYRTSIILYRNIGEFLTFMTPMKYCVAINGPNTFENWVAGAELRKNFADSKSYVSLQYEYERFFNLNKSLGLFGVNLGLVF
jgi:hypothetical protein